MTKINPPFRFEHIGSLLRPRRLLEAREQYANSDIGENALRAAEDEAIAAAIEKQERVGLRAISDGEFRRAYFHLDFLRQLDGISVTGGIAANPDAKPSQDGFTPPRLSVTGKLRHVRPIQVDDFNFLQAHTQAMPKVCLPSPTMVHFRGGRQAVDSQTYPDLEVFFDDLAGCYRDEIQALYDAGCRYIQLDDTNLAYLCDPNMRAAAAERGDDPEALPHRYAQLINTALAGRPGDLTVGVHLCRGNYRSTWFAQGGYEPVAEPLFNELDVDAYFLEYDDQRSGDFAPLRFVPDDKVVVLGLVSTKVGALESAAELIARVDEAARYVCLERLCLSPQCGFSSTVEGNEITEDDQWAKLERVVTTANDIWR